MTLWLFKWSTDWQYLVAITMNIPTTPLLQNIHKTVAKRGVYVYFTVKLLLLNYRSNCCPTSGFRTDSSSQTIARNSNLLAPESNVPFKCPGYRSSHAAQLRNNHPFNGFRPTTGRYWRLGNDKKFHCGFVLRFRFL